MSSALDERLKKIESDIREGKKPKIVSFLKEVPRESRADFLRAILRCHLAVRHEAGKNLSPDHYAKFGKMAISIAKQEIEKLGQTDSTSADLTTIDLSKHRVRSDKRPPIERQTRNHLGVASNTLNLDVASGNKTSTNRQLANIDRYRIDRLLGKGGFGSVYLGFDEKLERSVAIKLPHAHIIEDKENFERCLQEARTVANLDHPNIVPVHDVGSTDEHPFYIVSKFIEGRELTDAIEERRLTFTEATSLTAKIAKALHHAHKHGIVHRDIKPGNILIGADETPYLVDFGLAYRDQDPLENKRRVIGTPAYMSPEQASGEGHRINGQSDIFSLGVVFYELLTGRRPFFGNDITEILNQIRRVEPRPLRQYDEKIPPELERICLKAISKKAEHRYSTAFDLAEELGYCLDLPSQTEHSRSGNLAGDRQSVALKPELNSANSKNGISNLDSGSIDSEGISILPKGLRSFDVHDAEFFLKLLPGPRSRLGLPDSVRFWKTKLEERNRENTFPVGLLYGPSGCGKSSFIKSGLLPNLNESLVTVYIEATPDETEERLLNGINRHIPDTRGEQSGLSETIAAIRRGHGLPPGQKLVLVLDQFEQWLHSRTNIADTELVRAIRHCDGERVQCIVAVRDDFWMGATRFMRELEVRQEEGNNAAAVDLFPARHARKVLVAFGQALGTLPESTDQLDDEHNRFLDSAIDELKVDEKVICVRLALFAEMMKNREWNSQSLANLGGVEGLGVNYLEETFVNTTAPPRYRYHQKAVRNMLRGLVPETGADIKGEMKSGNQLRALSGYQNSAEYFEELIQILDNETRLITPTDPKGTATGGSLDSAPDMKYYQLAHDYLVPSIQNWLALKQRETKQGRAGLLLAERSSLWNSKQENRQLPTLPEYLGIRRHLKRSLWTAPQQTMMNRASKFYGLRTGIATLVLALVAATSWFVWRNSIETQQQEAASEMVNVLMSAMTEKTPTLIESMRGFEQWTVPIMESKAKSCPPGSLERLHLSLGLVTEDSSQIKFLLQRLGSSNPTEVEAIRIALQPHSAALKDRLWELTKEEEALLPAASLLANFDPDAAGKWTSIATPITHQLIAESIENAVGWSKLLKPTSQYLTGPLKKIYLSDAQGDKREFDRARDLLELNANRDWPRIADMILIAERGDFVDLFKQFASEPDKAAQFLEHSLNSTNVETGLQIRQVANAAIASLKLGNSRIFLEQIGKPGTPDVRTFITHALRDANVSASSILDLLKSEKNDTSRIGLLHALGTYKAGEVSQVCVDLVFEIFESDPHPGTHAAARWALSCWGQGTAISKIESQLNTATISSSDKPSWYITKINAHTMSVVPGPIEFQIGSPKSEKSRQDDEVLSSIKIDRTFAISSTEVTVKQFGAFKTQKDDGYDYPLGIAPSADHPRIALDWYQAAQYCRWLSEQEGVDESQMCYPPVSQIKRGMKLDPSTLSRTGYRLPTEAEWEFACRAGTTTSRFFGNSDALIEFYAYGIFNSKETTHPVATLIPNNFGIHDTYGNAGEWCQQALHDYSRYNGSDRLVTLTLSNKAGRVMRGGRFSDLKSTLRSAVRPSYPPGLRANSFGLRIARTMPEE